MFAGISRSFLSYHIHDTVLACSLTCTLAFEHITVCASEQYTK